jgi:hypothetical protein
MRAVFSSSFSLRSTVAALDGLPVVDEHITVDSATSAAPANAGMALVGMCTNDGASLSAPSAGKGRSVTLACWVQRGTLCTSVPAQTVAHELD